MNVSAPRRSTTVFRDNMESTDSVNARNEARLAPFNRHKKDLLAILHKVHERNPKSAPFDEEKSWRRLTEIAQWYFLRNEMRKGTMPAAERVKRLGKLEEAFGWARITTEQAMHDDVGDDLFVAVIAEENITRASGTPYGDGSPAMIGVAARQVTKAVAILKTLENAARRAARDVRRPGGRPKGTAVLQPDHIIGLAGLYRRSTGAKPGAGPGPFSRFVCEFLRGVGQSDPVSASVIDAIKDARAKAPKLLAATGYPIVSPFD